MGRTLALAACLIVAALLAWLGERTPPPSPAQASARAFSAARAFADIAVVARAPHPTGSPANAVVRDHLLRRMGALGLAPTAQVVDSFADHPRADLPTLVGGRVVNLVGVLPGRDHSLPAVAVMAHYDSVPASPGAADDAAGVAAALETVRALKARGPLRREVVVVLTEGEEQDLLGARAFFARDPLARRVGFVVNMEARGGGGRARMFQTGPRNGETIGLFRRAVDAPSASSLAVYLYERMPNDTDFSIARAKGLPGLNFAFVGRQFDYHSASSTPAALDLGSVQDMGAQVLAVTAAAADAATLPRPAPDWAFSQVPGGPLAGYPADLGWIVLSLAAILVVLAIRRARPAAIVGADIVRGAGAGGFLLLGGACVLHAARRASGAGFGFLEQHWLLAQSDRFETALMLLGVGVLLYAAAELARGRRGIAGFALAAGIAGAVFGQFEPLSLGLGAAALLMALIVFRRPAAVPGAWLGLLATAFAAALGLQIAAAPAAPIVAWPLLLAAALAAASALWTRRPWPIWIVTAAGAAIGLGWLGGLAHGLYLGLDAPELLALVVWLAAVVVWPLAQPDKDVAGTPFAAIFVLAGGIGLLALVRIDAPWSPRHPQASQVVYHQDLATGEAFRVSATPDAPGWVDAVLVADDGGVRTRAVPLVFDRPVDAAPAQPIVAAAPRFTLSRGADGRLTLAVAPPPGAARLDLEIASNVVLDQAQAAGLESTIAPRPDRPIRVLWTGDTGYVLSFRSPGAGALVVRYAAVTPGWPAEAKPLPPRPADVMPFGISDSTVVTDVERLTW